MRLSSYLINTPYRPQRVLGISKLSSLEFLKRQNPDLNESQILSRMKENGKDPKEILHEHRLQIACEKNLADVLKKLDISFRITKRIGNASKCVDWADLVIPIGGDGTFLLASKLIKDNTKPVLGINPNVGNQSNTFTLPLKYTKNIELIFEKLHIGEYSFLMRSRIQTVFMGEFLAVRAITLTVQVDDKEKYMIRSSGMCVCTGSGSRSWYKSMNFQPVDTVQKVVAIATGKQLNQEEANELLYRYHANLLYPPEDLRMTYMVREMYHTSRCSSSKNCPEKQMCHKVKVKSGGFDAGLVLDGCVSLPFNDGTTASFDIKPQYALKHIILE